MRTGEFIDHLLAGLELQPRIERAWVEEGSTTVTESPGYKYKRVMYHIKAVDTDGDLHHFGISEEFEGEK